MFDGQEHIPKLLPCSHTICLECLTRCGHHTNHHHHPSHHHHHIITPINIITLVITITPINIITPINTILSPTSSSISTPPPASSNRLLSYHPILSYQLYFLHFPEKINLIQIHQLTLSTLILYQSYSSNLLLLHE